MSQNEKLVNWFESEKNKDSRETELYKKKIINQIKKEKKLIPEKEKISIWKRIRKVLIGF